MSEAAIDSIEMIRRLVGFDTTSRESNLALIDWVRDYLDGYGVASRADVRRRPAQGQSLRHARARRSIGGIVLSGHTDVVPVDGQDWDTDPFTVRRQDGRLYGRGVADMKSFLAVALAFVPRVPARAAAADADPFRAVL